jgi:succinate dehydrogenase/fumarate reductase flavoprotein subunit
VATEDFEVVIAGFGPAGMAASISAAESGLKTVVVEKGQLGTYRSPTIGGLDDRIHQQLGVIADKKEWLDDAMVNNGFRANQAIYQRWLDVHAEAVNWWLDLFGVPDEQFILTFNSSGMFPDFKEPYGKTSVTRSWNSSINLPMAPPDIVTLMTDKATAAGADLRFETPAVQLVKEGDAVVALVVQTAEGYVRLNASKGVVLATGGYEYNSKKLVECCRPRDLALIGWMNATITNTGDGHEMGKAIGAIEDDYPHPLMLDPANLMPFVRVNKVGKRFCSEYEPYNHLANCLQQQPGAMDWVICDSNAVEAVNRMWTPVSGAFGMPDMWGGMAMSAEPDPRGNPSYTADTLEDLARQMGVPEDSFVATIEQWNADCAAAGDSVFSYPKEMMTPIAVPPYFAHYERAESLTTTGGLQITPDSEVIDINGQPIPGLYAIGNVSGSMFANTYPHNLNALSHSRCITFGYWVGRSLAGK